MNSRSISLVFALVLAGLAHGQTRPAPMQAGASTVKEPVQGGWEAPMQQEAIVLMDDVGERQDISSTFEEFRTTRIAALARGKGELSADDRGTLARKAAAIQESAPNSFEAHMAEYYARHPDPAAYTALDRAAMRDPTRPELIGPRLADAARRGNASELAQWSRAMQERGDVAPGLWIFAEDLLASVDRNGVLFAAGEMDAYPIWTLQHTGNQRADVLVVDTRQLGDPAYRRRIWEKTRAKGQVADTREAFIAALADATDRPVFLSSAIKKEQFTLPEDRLYVMGLTIGYSRTPIDNIPLVEERWARMRKTTGAGPLSRNYLVPAALLLQHYRDTGDERNAALMEHELRALARAMNATDQLYRAKILMH